MSVVLWVIVGLLAIIIVRVFWFTAQVILAVRSIVQSIREIAQAFKKEK